MKLWQKAAVGLGVPLGVFLVLTLVGLAYTNFTKKKGARGEVIDLEEGQSVKKPENGEAPKPKVIKWNPHG